MKLTLEETFNAYLALKKISTKPLKVDNDFLSYKIGNLENDTLKPAQLFEKIRLSVIKKHGEEDKEKNIVVPPDKEAVYEEELKNKLLEVESQMEKELTFSTIKVSIFKGQDIAPEFFRGMGKLIEQ